MPAELFTSVHGTSGNEAASAGGRLHARRIDDRCAGRSCPGQNPEGFALYRAADPGSHRHQDQFGEGLCLSGLRHARRHGQRGQFQAPDARSLGGQQRQADLHLHPPRRAGLERRHAGDVRRLRRLDRAMGQARSLRRRHDGRGRQPAAHRCEAVRDASAPAIRLRHRGARPLRPPNSGHDARQAGAPGRRQAGP